MDIFCASSDASDTGLALDDVIHQLGIAGFQEADFLSAHFSHGYDVATIGDRLGGRAGTSLHAGSSCLGVMSNSGMISAQGNGLGVFAIKDPEGSYGTGMAPFDGDPRAAARAAITQALDAADRPGEAPDLVWLTASPGTEEQVLRGITDEVGENVPIVGGSAADNDISGAWKISDGRDCLGEGVVVSVLFPSTRLSIAYQSGYAPTQRTGIVTGAAGRRLSAIDGRPAAEVYGQWTGGDVVPRGLDAPAMILSESTFTPLGRHAGDVAEVPFYLLSHPAAVHPDGSIDLFTDIAEGEEVTLMQGAADSLTSRAGRVAAFAAARGRLARDGIAGALVIYCGGCMLAVNERMDEVARGIDQALGGAPFLGIFTFGEQGPILDGYNAHGNLMISCVTLAR
ncbi:MAG: FIST N-terminal domain-containing protein [Pseudomonadota bacterium]